ncbi:GspE/PulE family protein [Patescibacteria group bacterium]|nr:GspE/PulE family protein [Patescibacteria group bacterium]
MLNIDDLLKYDQNSNFDDSKERQLKNKLSHLEDEEIEEKVSTQARSMGLPYMNLTDFPVSEEALRMIPKEGALNYQAICFYRTDRLAKIGSLDPQNNSFSEFCRHFEAAHDLNIEIYLISANSFNAVLKRYETLPKIREMAKGVEISAEDFKKFENKIQSFQDLNQEIQKTDISNLITLVIASSVKSRASDIHIEAEEDGIKLRFRVDGILIDVAEIDKKFWLQVISRIKLLSGLKINVVGRPQDGRFVIKLEKEKIDVRVSCLPTSYGESVVMRLLRSSTAGLSFEDLGLRGRSYQILKREVERPNGMIITTGPTGSGKTTTLYAIINKLNDEETKIITLEDPIEYRVKGVNQSQVDQSKDYTFANGLRSILRQDPDVVMVGEIRDAETAKIAIQSALTGHMVVSTLHTNDAAGALPRFLSMGVKPFLLAPALNAVIGQRLVRRICEKCKKEVQLTSEKLERVKALLKDIPSSAEVKIDFNNLKFYQGEGCPACQGLGYHGRIGIYEVLAVNAEVEKAILEGSLSEYKARELSQQQGMVTMVQDGLLKALDGITSIEEVFRVAE